MISLTKLNGVPFLLNSAHIETVHESPDTTIMLTNGKLYIVQESMAEVEQRVLDYQRAVFATKVQR